MTYFFVHLFLWINIAIIFFISQLWAIPSSPQSTGQDYTASGGVNYDDNWLLTSVPSSTSFSVPGSVQLMSPQHDGWLISTVTAQWVYLSGDPQNAGSYTYETQYFSACGGEGTLEFAADDYVTSITINGVAIYTNSNTGGQYGTFNGVISFSAIPGVNTIDVIVYNEATYSGLIVYFNSYTEYTCTPTLAPTSIPTIIPTRSPTVVPTISPTMAPQCLSSGYDLSNPSNICKSTLFLLRPEIVHVIQTSKKIQKMMKTIQDQDQSN